MVSKLWTVTFMSNDSKGGLIESMEFEYKVGATSAIWKYGKPSHITRVGRAYTVSVNKSR